MLQASLILNWRTSAQNEETQILSFEFVLRVKYQKQRKLVKIITSYIYDSCYDCTQISIYFFPDYLYKNWT